MRAFEGSYHPKTLRARVWPCELGLKRLGGGCIDRLAAIITIHTDAVIAIFAKSSLGAIWTAVSPDPGIIAALDCFTPMHGCVLIPGRLLHITGKSIIGCRE